MPADGPTMIPLATARRAAVRVLRGLASHPDALRMGVGGALRRMEARVPAVEVIVSTLADLAAATGRIEAAVDALDFVAGGCIAPDLPLALRVVAEADWTETVGSVPGVEPGVLDIAAVRGAFHIHVAPGLGGHGLARVADRAMQEGYDWMVAVAPPAHVAALGQGLATLVLPPPDPDAPSDRPPFRAFAAEVVRAGTPDTPAALPRILTPTREVGETIDSLSHPRVKVLGHPATTPGAWWEREADDVANWQQVLEAAAAHDVALEFSGAPRAAWLPDAVHDIARGLGVRVIPGADARTPNDIDDILCAVGPLRLAGWRADEVAATWDAERFGAWWRGSAD